MSPGGGRRASARAAPYPAASRTRTSTLGATRMAAARRSPAPQVSETIGGIAEQGRETAEHSGQAGRPQLAATRRIF